MSTGNDILASPRSEYVDGLVKVVERVHAAGASHDALRRCLEAWHGTLTRFSPGGEAQYMTAIEGLPRETLDAMAEGLGILVMHFYREGRYADLLGPVYMRLGSLWGRKILGQHFTPWQVAVLMAELSLGGLEERLAADDGEPITVHEPTLGSGVMLLAVRGVVAAHYGQKALRRLQFSGQDIDPLCCLMAKIQLLLSNVEYMGFFFAAFAVEMALCADEVFPKSEDRP